MKFGKIWHYLQKFSQIVAWLLALAIIMVSVGPPTTRPVTGTGHSFEHLAIFWMMGTAFGFGYPRRIMLLPIALMGFSAAIEAAQIMIPGRHARLGDFLTDAAASCLAVIVSQLLVKFAMAKR